MKYWKRAAGALKDKNSIWLAGLGPNSTHRNAHLEKAIIRATSHDDTQVDYRNTQRVFAWVRTSPYHLKPLVRALSIRMDKTRSWVVALKGLILIHGVYCCKIPAVRKIGRLPFDLSNFSDAHLKPAKSWGYNAFVRAYFAFLDQKSSFMCSHGAPERGRPKRLLVLGKSKSMDAGIEQPPLADELETFQNLQSLLDLLIQVKPQANGMRTALIMEAMDCIIIEIFDVYSKICTHIARILSRIYDANRYEASLAFKILQQANSQAEELSQFFDFCILLGVLNASQFPKVEQIPEDDMREVQRIVQGISDHKSLNNEEENNSESCDDKAIVARPSGEIVLLSSMLSARGRILTTAVTDKWETFEDDLNLNGAIATHSSSYESVSNTSYMSPASTALALVPHSTPQSYSVSPYKQEMPDLISF